MEKRMFTGHTKLFLSISAAIVVVAILLSIFGFGMNLGIDFTGGSLLNYSVGESYDVKDVEGILNAAGYTQNQITKAAPSDASVALMNAAKEDGTYVESGNTVADDGMYDLQVRLNLVDNSEANAKSLTDALTEALGDPAEVVALNAAAYASRAINTDFIGGQMYTFALTEDFDMDDVSAKVVAALDASGVKLEDVRIEKTTAEALAAATPEEEVAADATEAPAEDAPEATEAPAEDSAAVEATEAPAEDSAAVEATEAPAEDAAAVEATEAPAEDAAAVEATEAPAEETADAEGPEETAEDTADAEGTEETAEDTADAEGTEETAEGAEAVTAALADGTGVTIQDADSGDMLCVLVKPNDQTSLVRKALESQMTEKYPNFKFVSIEHVSATSGKDLINNAIKSILIVFVCLLIYIGIRFSLFSGLATLFALVHDVLIMCAFMVFFRGFFQVNSPFIAAVLTIVGYSINNTIVVFDRIREVAKRPGADRRSHQDIVEEAVGKTLTRTINTSLTTLFTLVALFVFGVDSIREFAFPLIVGMLAGTYSSVLLSGQVWAFVMDKRAAKKA